MRTKGFEFLTTGWNLPEIRVANESEYILSDNSLLSKFISGVLVWVFLPSRQRLIKEIIMEKFCFKYLNDHCQMPQDLYIAYHYVVNSLHWVWEGAPLTDELQMNMDAAESRFECRVWELSRNKPQYKRNLAQMYRWVRVDVESRKKAALDKINPPAPDD